MDYTIDFPIFNTLICEYLGRQCCRKYLKFINRTQYYPHLFLFCYDGIEDVEYLKVRYLKLQKSTKDLHKYKNLIKVIFGTYFNQKLDIGIFPNSVTYVTFGWNFNQKLDIG